MGGGDNYSPFVPNTYEPTILNAGTRLLIHNHQSLQASGESKPGTQKELTEINVTVIILNPIYAHKQKDEKRSNLHRGLKPLYYLTVTDTQDDTSLVCDL